MDETANGKMTANVNENADLDQSYYKNSFNEKDSSSLSVGDTPVDRKSDDSLNLGQIIKETGDFGRFQVLSFAYTSIVLVTLTWSMLTMAFTATIPDWSCVIGGNTSEPKVCDVNGSTCDAISFSDGMSTAVSQWTLVCDNKWISQSITTIQMTGLLVGGLVWGHISDGIGRKPTFFFNLALLGVFNLISVFSVNWEMFAAMRFVIGFGCTGFMASSLTFEFIRNKWRVYLFLVPSWAFWASMMAVFCWRVPDWRYIHVVVAAVTLPGLLGWFFLPESFRWLVSHGRVEEAENSIKYVAKINGKPPPDLDKLKAVIEKEQLAAKETKALQVYTVLDLFRTSKIRKTTILFSLIWLFSAYSYYGIAFGVQELSGSLYLNMFLVSIVDVPGNILVVIFNTCGGRKWTCVGFYLLGGIFAVVVGVFQYINFSISGSMLNSLALAAKLCVSAAWEINTLWSNESFPTVVRMIGGGFVSSISRVGSMVAPQIITLSVDRPGLLYLISGIVCVLSSAMCAFLEETKNKDLSDMLPQKTKRLPNDGFYGEKTIQVETVKH
ncbi:solute carrier family 22 member 21-like [Mercenaria mercenaria]|uniref:solute carrier family 22 member 21-like n=1 Tax=Mercenaria mercenaria TaxID=6596 RepID=UPI00234EF238|nr:solute carrier family 22 member 21-like [Mercenaria mercenaria]XP_053397069.1 solute carrier family 22 member 21-like [Mercenaria mercenaria]